MKYITEMTKKDIKNIRLIVLDVDGVLVPRGTKIKQEGNTTTLETKRIAEKQIEQIGNDEKNAENDGGDEDLFLQSSFDPPVAAARPAAESAAQTLFALLEENRRDQ